MGKSFVDSPLPQRSVVPSSGSFRMSLRNNNFRRRKSHHLSLLGEGALGQDGPAPLRPPEGSNAMFAKIHFRRRGRLTKSRSEEKDLQVRLGSFHHVSCRQVRRQHRYLDTGRRRRSVHSTVRYFQLRLQEHAVSAVAWYIWTSYAGWGCFWDEFQRSTDYSDSAT